MAELKTQPTETSVADFLATVEPPQRRADGEFICDLLQRITGERPRMWGPSIIGFGSYAYRYNSGRTGTSCRLGFSPRKAQLVFYGMGGEEWADRLAALGKHKTGKGCLYITRLEEVDLAALEALARAAWDRMNVQYPPA